MEKQLLSKIDYFEKKQKYYEKMLQNKNTAYLKEQLASVRGMKIAYMFSLQMLRG